MDVKEGIFHLSYNIGETVMISLKRLTHQLLDLGVAPGGVLLVHFWQNFNLVNGWLDAQGLQRKGKIGHALAHLVRSRDIVSVMTERLRHSETTSLHPFGIDEECDEARMSLQ